MTTAYILNHVPLKLVPFTPYELWTGEKPNLGNLQPWGSVAYVHTTSHKDGKLGPKGNKCIFIRYSEHSKGYVFIGENNDRSSIEIESRDVDFLEEDFPNKGK